jgi:quinol monooxygenase YgiN
MIVVNAVVSTSTEDITTLKDAIGVMETASRAESGCDDYTFSVELNNPKVLRITEKWQSIEALQAHMQTPHMADFQKAMGGRPPASLEVTFYEAKEIQPF